MARLIVEAIASLRDAASGNREPVLVTVSVTREDGTAVWGLNEPNVTMYPLLQTPGGDGGEVTTMSNGTHGMYNVSVVPRPGRNWGSGRHIMGIGISSGDDEGQTIFEFTMGNRVMRRLPPWGR